MVQQYIIIIESELHALPNSAHKSNIRIPLACYSDLYCLKNAFDIVKEQILGDEFLYLYLGRNKVT